MSGAKYQKTLPKIDEESRGYWEALQRHELYFQRCADCRLDRFPTRAVCPQCMSSAVEWVRASGNATVYSYTVTHQNQAPGFRETLPYILAVVQLEEGPRMMTNLIDVAPDAVTIGMAVAVVFEDVTPEITLAKFRPA